jgi:hypothetical protein
VPAIAALVINDGQGTPVAHTFSPQSVTDGSKSAWSDRSPSIPAGFKSLNFEIKAPAGNRTVHQLSFGLSDPKVATVNSVDTVVRYNSFSIVLNIHPEATLQERKDLLAYAKNLLGHANVSTAVENLESFY